MKTTHKHKSKIKVVVVVDDLEQCAECGATQMKGEEWHICLACAWAADQFNREDFSDED